MRKKSIEDQGKKEEKKLYCEPVAMHTYINASINMKLILPVCSTYIYIYVYIFVFWCELYWLTDVLTKILTIFQWLCYVASSLQTLDQVGLLAKS